jgi:hypothetical protein
VNSGYLGANLILIILHVIFGVFLDFESVEMDDNSVSEGGQGRKKIERGASEKDTIQDLLCQAQTGPPRLLHFRTTCNDRPPFLMPIEDTIAKPATAILSTCKLLWHLE